MESISHRDLRNRSSEVLRAVSEGESFVVTNHGAPVARVVPIDEPRSDLRVIRPAVRRGGFSDLRPVTVQESTAEILGALRSDR